MKRSTAILFGFLLTVTTGCSLLSTIEKENIPRTTNHSYSSNNQYENEIEKILEDLKESANAQADTGNNDARLNFSNKLKELSDLFQTTKSSIHPNQSQDLIDKLEQIQFLIYENDFKSALDKLTRIQVILDDAQNPGETPQSGLQTSKIRSLEQSIDQQNNAINEVKIGPIAIPFPFFLTQISSLIGLISLLIAIAALSRVKKQKNEVEKLIAKSRKLENNLNNIKYDIECTIMPNQKDNRSRIDKLEKHSNQQINASQEVMSSPSTDRYDKPATQITPSYVAPEPIGPNKSMLVTALNSGDRQQLKDATISQLNITSKSENDRLIGRSTMTELEIVSGGGSYQLIIINEQSWLFPTEQTLRGFDATQSTKGIFDYEERIISRPELVEPALVEQSGSKWIVKQLGKIYIPKI